MVNSFDGEFAFLSNFANSEIQIDGIVYPTMEHFFQAMKTTDITLRRSIASQLTPGKAKRMGRNVHLRSDWEEVKNDVMLFGLRQKFAKEPFRSQLLATTDYLEEGNTWHDNFWGVCHCGQCSGGKNRLGQLLMQVRDEVRECGNKD